MITLRRLALLLLLLWPAIPLVAQPGPGGPPPDADRPVERVERLKKIRLIELLEMGEEQSVRFFARMSEHERARGEFVKARNDALDRLERLVRNKAEDREYEKAIGEVREANQKTIEHERKFFEGLSDILSSEQRAKLVLFERRFQRELREAMRDQQRRRGGKGVEEP